jgi:glycosyltransferase involved in cell wall biosynthesis
MLNPEVSVVITTYNEENFIEKAIKSVLNQTLPKNMYELIVIDDGGVDSTQDIISNLQSKTDFKIKYTKKNNGGTASARNLGVSKSSAPFISFLDGDDFYDPRKLEESLKFMRKGDSVGIVYSDYIERYPDRAQLRLKMNFDRELLFKECIVSTNSMVRRSAIERVGGFDESFRYIED